MSRGEVQPFVDLLHVVRWREGPQGADAAVLLGLPHEPWVHGGVLVPLLLERVPEVFRSGPHFLQDAEMHQRVYLFGLRDRPEQLRDLREPFLVSPLGKGEVQPVGLGLPRECFLEILYR